MEAGAGSQRFKGLVWPCHTLFCYMDVNDLQRHQQGLQQVSAPPAEVDACTPPPGIFCLFLQCCFQLKSYFMIVGNDQAGSLERVEIHSRASQSPDILSY